MPDWTGEQWNAAVLVAGVFVVVALMAVYLWDGPGPNPPPGGY